MKICVEFGLNNNKLQHNRSKESEDNPTCLSLTNGISNGSEFFALTCPAAVSIADILA